jgi:hypothetical protein
MIQGKMYPRNMSCNTDAPLLESSFTAIMVAGPIVCAMFIFFMSGCNLAMKKLYLCLAWFFIGGMAMIWFWSAFAAGFTPEYLESRYLPANATLINTTEEAYQCTELHNCVCVQSFDQPCAVVESELLDRNASGSVSAPCAGKSCCARQVYRCIRTETSCRKDSCTTRCASGFYDCIAPVSASRCTAVGGTCRKATADYTFTTRCNQTGQAHFEVTCRINEQNCIRDFMNSMPVERVIYYAPWDPTKQTVHYVKPKGQIANIVLPMLVMFGLVAAQVVVMAAWILHRCRQSRDGQSASLEMTGSSSAALSSSSVV